jgi:hypothetical protein
MPGKSRRVAARQAQLGRRRKKAQKEPGSILPPAAVPVEVDGKHAEAAPGVVPEPPRPQPSPAPPRPSPVASRATAASTGATPRLRGERPPTHNYVGSEMRRILLLGASVLAVIIVLGVLL